MADALDSGLDPPPADHDGNPFAAERRADCTSRLLPRIFALSGLDPPRAPAEALTEDQAGFATAVTQALSLIRRAWCNARWSAASTRTWRR